MLKFACWISDSSGILDSGVEDQKVRCEVKTYLVLLQVKSEDHGILSFQDGTCFNSCVFCS